VRGRVRSVEMLALLLVAGSLGLNDFAGSIAVGTSGVDHRLRVRVALAFGLFEAGMPIIGLLMGRSLSHSLGSSAHIVGGLLLIAVGLQATYVATRADPGDATETVATAGTGRLLVLAAALSIDNLVVGFALGAYHVSIEVAALVIGVVSVVMSLAGLELGARLGGRLGEKGELAGGVALIGVGIAMAAGIMG
jgi:putative Mn2+ efflux pump MntP